MSDSGSAWLSSSKSTPASPRSFRSQALRQRGSRTLFAGLLGASGDRGVDSGHLTKRSLSGSGLSNTGEEDTSSKTNFNRSTSFIPFLKRPQSDLSCNASCHGALPSGISSGGDFAASLLAYPKLVDVLSNSTTEPFDLKSLLHFAEGHVSTVLTTGWG